LGSGAAVRRRFEQDSILEGTASDRHREGNVSISSAPRELTPERGFPFSEGMGRRGGARIGCAENQTVIPFAAGPRDGAPGRLLHDVEPRRVGKA